MATFFDGPLGMIPASECKKFAKYPVSATLANKIYKGTPVMLLGGVAVPYDENHVSVSDIVGIAIHHVDTTPGAGVTVTVTDDPSMEFYCLSDGAFTAADVGAYIGFIANGAANGADSGSNDVSTAMIDESSQAAAPTAVAPLKIMGLAGLPNNSSSLVADSTPVLRVKIMSSLYFL